MSKIQWTDETWNPTVGCSRVSPGCDNCYAEKVAARGMQDAHRGLTEDGKWTGEVRMLADRLDTPLRWKKPRRVFVDSMSDLFHEDVPEAFIRQVFDVMAQAERHTFQILTKRPERMARLAILDRPATPEEVDDGCELGIWPGLYYDRELPNVWLGTSVETDRYARIRIPRLLRCKAAALRFLSVEPMLGPVDLQPYLGEGIGWVIIGGESGFGARPLEVQWVRDLIAQCRDANTAVFVKQLGARPLGLLLDDRKGGDWDEWPEDLRVREYPVSA